MRVDPYISAILNAGIQNTQQSLNASVEQLASGQRVAVPSDDPAAAAANLESLASSANVDGYTRNGDAVLSQVHMADSALSSVIGELNQAVALGTQGADGTMNSADRVSISTQVQSILSEVVSQANTTFNGTSLFAGTAGVTEAFAADSSSPNGYTYQGDGGVNSATIGSNLQVNVNIPGDQIFTNPSGNVLGSLQQLVSALNSGTASDIGAAVAGVNSAITNVSQQRVVYAGAANQINSQESYLSQETVSLTAQQQSLTGIDMATAITNMTQAQTAHSAVLAAAAKVLPTSLLDYLN
ncbi:MAG TPA: flagellin [Acidobacteriaceae bacterium]|nr:flagellin [Acidobacteriaceae bacterium]